MPPTFPINIALFDQQMRVDANGRSDLQPVFQFFSPPGTGVDELWTVGYKFTYGSGGDLTRRQVVFKKNWTDRANHF